MKKIRGRSLVGGRASGLLLASDTSLSFWCGIDSETGIVVDQHHPLRGQCVTGSILAIPSGRGSCTGSGVLLELLLREQAPAALIFQHVEEILTLGVLVARALFARSLPVLVLSPEDFSCLSSGTPVTMTDDELHAGIFSSPFESIGPANEKSTSTPITLSLKDERLLAGNFGSAPKLAMEILIGAAEVQGATAFLDVSQAHIDACIYIGPASLAFAQRFVSLGARFAVPTTLNSISIDKRRWKEIGMDPAQSKEAEKLAEAYMSMGAAMSFTCAPYLLETAPEAGPNIGWAESNAVVFANSVLGARTQKYPDFLDVCIALTGRAPASGCHLDEERLPKIEITATNFPGADDQLWPLAGYHIGKISGPQIPIIYGLDYLNPTMSDLKAFGAAFATMASAPMFHIAGITPEAAMMQPSTGGVRSFSITRAELQICWEQLNTATDASVGLVSLGNPHFSFEEFEKLSMLCSGRKKHAKVELIITTSRSVSEKAAEAGYIDFLDSFGARVITDTCWCMLEEPLIPLTARNIVTNSAKYAHYAPGMVRRGVHFGSLANCVEAACHGEWIQRAPEWLTD